MIKSFKCKDTENLYKRKFVKRFSGSERQAERRFRILKAAPDLNALMKLPSNHFEALKGGRKEQYSIRINMQWCICFKWDDGPAEVEIVDYH